MTFYRNALVVLFTAIFFIDVPDYMSRLMPELAPIGWVIGLYLVSVPVLVKTLWESDILRSPVVIWCFGFLWLSVAWFFLSSQSDNVWQVLRWHVYTILLILGFLILIWDSNAVRFARYAVAAGVLFGVAINIYELFVPMAFSLFAGRSAGLYGDPNISGEALLLGMIVSLTLVPAWCRGAFILAAGIGICLTVSRANILAWIIVSCTLILLHKVHMKKVLMTVMLGLVLVVVVLLPMGGQLLDVLQMAGTINRDVLLRLEWFTNPTGVSDDSSVERKLLAEQAWDKVAERPLLGGGTGASYVGGGSMGTHNQYLALMQDHGLLGALIVPLLILAVAWKARGETKQLAMIFGGVVIWQSFFSHNILDLPPRLMLFALMTAFSWSSRTPELNQVQVVQARDEGAPKALVEV